MLGYKQSDDKGNNNWKILESHERCQTPKIKTTEKGSEDAIEAVDNLFIIIAGLTSQLTFC